MIVIGNINNYELVSSRPIYDPNLGLYWERVWEGTQAAIEAFLADAHLSDDERWDIDTTQLPLARLTVRTPDYTDGQISSLQKWDLVHNKVERDIFEIAKTADSNIGRTAMTDLEIESVAQAVKDKNGSDVFDDWNTNQQRLYGMVVKKQNKYLTFEYVLRTELVASNRYGVLVSFNNSERIFTTAQLGTPSVSGIIIPAGIGVAIATIPAKTNIVETINSVSTTTWKWGWLKQPPDMEQLPSGKLIVRQEYYLELWPTWVYASAA